MADKKLFNPDIEIYNADDSTEQQLNKNTTLHYSDVTFSALDCPYDGTYCRQKAARFLRWRTAVKHCAENHIDHTFMTNQDTFKKCPLPNDVNCIRRLRYENIVKQLKQNAK